MVIALILSGGTGTRMGTEIPKQYMEVGGKKIIEYCLETFQKCEKIDGIQIVADEKWTGLLGVDRYDKWKGVSKPGRTRQESIMNGLQDILAYACAEDMVMIHDAARPLVSTSLVEELIRQMNIHEGAIPVLPMKDTVYFSEDGGRISALLERKCIYAGQAPEIFNLGLYWEANKALGEEALLKINGSTEPAVLAGMDIGMIPGEERNFKITTGEDLERFKRIMETEK